MKHALAVALFGTVALMAWSFDLTSINYMQAQIPNSQTVVRLTSLKEFITLVESKQPDLVYRLDAGTSNASFAFLADGAIYEVADSGFTSVADAAKGISLGLLNGGELAVARQYGFSDRQEVTEFSAQYYRTVQDYRSAVRNGFRDSMRTIKFLALPDEITADQMSRIVLPQITWAILRAKAHNLEPFGKVQTNSYGPRPNYVDPNGNQLIEILEAENLVSTKTWTLAEFRSAAEKLAASPRMMKWAIKLFPMYALQSSGTLKAGSRSPQSLNWISVMDGIVSGPSRNSAAQEYLKQMADAGFDRVQLQSIIANLPTLTGQLTDATVFAAAELSGISSATEFLALNNARALGYQTVAEFRLAQDGNYKSAGQFREGQALGVTNARDLETVQRAAIRDRAIAAKYLGLVATLKSINARYQTRDPLELTVAFVLTRLPVSVPYGADGILRALIALQKPFLITSPQSQPNDLFSRAAVQFGGPETKSYSYQSSTLPPPVSYSERITMDEIDNLEKILANAPWVSEIGTYNAETAVFVRK